MMKKMLCFLMVISSLCGCSSSKQQMYSNTFMGPFDTLFQVMSYEESQSDFDEYFEYVEEEFTRLHQLYDKYNNYDGINNVKTINDKAGVEPVHVDEDLYNLIETSLYYQQQIGNKVNIALGSVLNVWHNYRELNDGSVPKLAELQAANQYTDVNNIVLDEQNQTVYIKDQNTSIDVGAIAKGYACELVKQELITRGLDDFLISAGGNVISYGKRAVKKEANSLSEYLPSVLEYFAVDIASPSSGAYQNVPKILALSLQNNESVVTSGDYQRYFEGSDGKMYHHLIDPDTLYPGNYCRSLTIVTENSGLADFLSSTLFLMSPQDGLDLINRLNVEVEAIWLLEDGQILHTNGIVEGENTHVYAKAS